MAKEKLKVKDKGSYLGVHNALNRYKLTTSKSSTYSDVHFLFPLACD